MSDASRGDLSRFDASEMLFKGTCVVEETMLRTRVCLSETAGCITDGTVVAAVKRAGRTHCWLELDRVPVDVICNDNGCCESR